MNGAGRWRCYLGWMLIHTVMTTSPITHGHLRQGIGRKIMNTFSSPHTIFGSRVCKSVFKSCLLIQMTIPFDGTNFTQSIQFILYVHMSSNFFIGTHEHFAWIYWVRDVPKRQCRLGAGSVFDISWRHAQRTGGRLWLGADSTLLLALQPLSVMSRGGRLHSQTTSSASDVVMDVIPDREIEINHSYSPQLIKIIFCSYFISGAGVELRSLHLAVLSLNCDVHTVSNGWLDTYSITRRDMEDPNTFRISSIIYKTKASIGRRTMPTTMTCLRCTTRISIYKFLKSIKFM
jgi:hypothetical protein